MCSDACPKDEPAIVVDGVSKYFEIYEQPSLRLLQMLYRGRKQFYKTFWALNKINFEVHRGECVGIIGRNGAGKSTLLQIITGTLSPSSGEVRVRGRVAALLELGSGFNMEFTGRENVYLNASILGLSTKEIDEKYADIVSFADIGDFIDQPVKSYSSGMVVRLAFAVVAHVNADVLIVDEALAVGDAFFTQKCMRFMRKFMETNTVLFVSHDTAAVNSLCNRAVLLEHGEVKLIGTPKAVTEKYLEDMYESMQGKSELVHTPSDNEGKELESADNSTEAEISTDTDNLADVNRKQEALVRSSLLAAGEHDARDLRQDFVNASTLRNDIEVFCFDPEGAAFGKGGCTIDNVTLADEKGTPLNWIVGGERVTLRVLCTAHEELVSPIVGFHLKDRLGQSIFGDNTFLSYLDSPLTVSAGDSFQARFTFRMPTLAAGDYSFAVAVAEGSQVEHVQHQWRHDALILKSTATSCTSGIVGIPMLDISLRTVPANTN